jgi:hypothetical protein
MRDYRALLAHVLCWDATTEAVFLARGEALQDRPLQNREELIGLCEFIEEHGVRSYLEIGVWTGATLRALHSLFGFAPLAACDHGWAARQGLAVSLPAECQLYAGDSESAEFLAWRAALGPIDLVLVDGNHAYHAVKRDVERCRAFPSRFLALHDITGARRATTGVRRLWQEIVASGTGRTWEIVRPHVDLGLDHSVMGIGIWEPPSRV